MKTLERYYEQLRDWPLIQKAEAVDITGAARWAWASPKPISDGEYLYDYPGLTPPYEELWLEYGDVKEFAPQRSEFELAGNDSFGWAALDANGRMTSHSLPDGDTYFTAPLFAPGSWRSAAAIYCRELNGGDGEKFLRINAPLRLLRRNYSSYTTLSDSLYRNWPGLNIQQKNQLSQQNGNIIADKGQRARWMTVLELFVDGDVRLWGPGLQSIGVMALLLDDGGSVLIDETAYSQDFVEMIQGNGFGKYVYPDVLFAYAAPFLFALALMNAKNVSLIDQPLPPKVAAKRERKGKPVLKFKTLHIEPMRQRVKSETKPGESEVKVALHLCRGHFKDYRNSGGLFGKYKGLYWWDSQVRGTEEAGRVIKDYALEKPRAA